MAWYPITMLYARKRGVWIVNHAGEFVSQAARGQALIRAVDEQERDAHGIEQAHVEAMPAAAGTRVWSQATWIEWFVIFGGMLVFPIAWPAGRALYKHFTTWIADRRLQAPPIVALVWLAAAVLALFALIVDGDHDALYGRGSSMTWMVMFPWLAVQLSGTFLIAGVYGLVEGWLAIPGATDVWPTTPPHAPGREPSGPIDPGPKRLHRPGEKPRP